MKITSHKVNPANDKLDIETLDAEGAGGAFHHYVVGGFDPKTNGAVWNQPDLQGTTSVDILFQNGPINEVGVNGITHEALLAILIHRMECFQAGPCACRENALALTKLQEAQMWLLERTRGRMNRGVEGTHEK